MVREGRWEYARGPVFNWIDGATNAEDFAGLWN
jgi:hypothetical protein